MIKRVKLSDTISCQPEGQQRSQQSSTLGSALKVNTQVQQQDSTRNVVCAGCRRRHIKCTGDGFNACDSCKSHREECTYPTRKRAGPRTGWLQQREQQYQEGLREVMVHKQRINELEDQLHRTQHRLTTGEPLTMAENEVISIMLNKFAAKQGSINTSNWSSASKAQNRHNAGFKHAFKELASLKRPTAKRLQVDCIAPSPAEPQSRLAPWGIISKSSSHLSVDQLRAVDGSCT